MNYWYMSQTYLGNRWILQPQLSKSLVSHKSPKSSNGAMTKKYVPQLNPLVPRGQWMRSPWRVLIHHPTNMQKPHHGCLFKVLFLWFSERHGIENSQRTKTHLKRDFLFLFFLITIVFSKFERSWWYVVSVAWHSALDLEGQGFNSPYLYLIDFAIENSWGSLPSLSKETWGTIPCSSKTCSSSTSSLMLAWTEGSKPPVQW